MAKLDRSSTNAAPSSHHKSGNSIVSEDYLARLESLGIHNIARSLVYIPQDILHTLASRRVAVFDRDKLLSTTESLWTPES